MVWTEVLITFFSIIAFTIFVIVVVKLKKSIGKIDVTANQPIVENDYRSEFTEGYVRGTVKSIKQNKNGTKLIEFYPIDVEQGENIKRPHLQSFIVKNEYFKPFSIGELSDKRIIIKTIVRDPSRIPEKLRDTTEGEWATKEGQLGHLRATFGNTIPSGDEAIDEFMKDWARGKMTKAFMAKVKEEVGNIKNILNPPQDEKPTK